MLSTTNNVSKALPLPSLSVSKDFDAYLLHLNDFVIGSFGPNAASILESDVDPRHVPGSACYVGVELSEPDLVTPAEPVMPEAVNADGATGTNARNKFQFEQAQHDRRAKLIKEELGKREKFIAARHATQLLILNSVSSDPDATILIRNVPSPAMCVELLRSHFDGTTGGKKDGAVVAYHMREYMGYVPLPHVAPNVSIAELDILRMKLSKTTSAQSDEQFLDRVMFLYGEDERYVAVIDNLRLCAKLEEPTLLSVSRALTIRFNTLALREIASSSSSGTVAFLGFRRPTREPPAPPAAPVPRDTKKGLVNNYIHAEVTCHECKQLGHHMNQCRVYLHRKRDENAAKKKESGVTQLFASSHHSVGHSGCTFQRFALLLLMFVSFFGLVAVKRL